MAQKSNMADSNFIPFWYRITACHLVTYFIAGVIAMSLLDYEEAFQGEYLSCLMQPITSRWVAAGPALQIIRGLILAVALFPFRDIILNTRSGWMKLAGLLIGLSVLSQSGPSPGSAEGFFFTKIPWSDQIKGWIEVIPQNVALAWIFVAWYNAPKPRLGRLMVGLMILGIGLSLAGVFLRRPQ